jgi:DNA (cytosine-5)-methyltransferase 1
LAEVLARAMRNQLLGEQTSLSPTLIPSAKRPIPAAEPVRPVAKKYHSLAGNHEAHPGTGRGYSAKQRRRGSQSNDQQPSLPLVARSF